jgi:hypothetical protein
MNTSEHKIGDLVYNSHDGFGYIKDYVICNNIVEYKIEWCERPDVSEWYRYNHQTVKYYKEDLEKAIANG